MLTAALNLSNLPMDIIRMVVQATTRIWESDILESDMLFGNMESVSLISQPWNTLVREYRNRLMLVEDCQIYAHPSKKLLFRELHVVLTVKSANAWYVQRFVRDKIKDWSWNEIERGNNGHYEIDLHTLLWHSIEDRKQIHDDEATAFMHRIFSPFRRICRLHMYCNEKRYLNIVKAALHPKLVIDAPIFMIDHFNDLLRAFFRKLLCKHGSREIRIYAKWLEERETCEFLHKISKRISTAYIEDLGEDPVKLFGVPKTCWEALAKEMIRNGMHLVWMKNDCSDVKISPEMLF